MSASTELPVGWEAAVGEALATSERPELASGTLRFLGAGMNSVALSLEQAGTSCVLRLPRVLYAAEALVREAALLPELAAWLPVPIPQFMFTAPNPLGPGEFCVYPAVPGESLSAAQWHRRRLLERPETARRIAETIEGIHSFPVSRARALGIETVDLRADFTEDLDSIRTEVVPLLPSAEGSALLAEWEGYLDDDRNFDYQPTLLHSDMSLDHLLVTADQITGLIDFGDMEIGDPDYDLSYLYPEAGSNFVRNLQQQRGSALDPRLETKLRFWCCADPALNILHALEQQMPEYQQQQLQSLTKALARFHTGRA